MPKRPTAPDDPQLLTLLAVVLATVQHGQLERRTGLLRDARLRDATNRDIRYHFAAGLAQAGARGKLVAS